MRHQRTNTFAVRQGSKGSARPWTYSHEDSLDDEWQVGQGGVEVEYRVKGCCLRAEAEGDAYDVLYASRAVLRTCIQGTIPIRISEDRYVPVAYSIAVQPI